MPFGKLICQLTFECVSLYHSGGPGKNTWACGGEGTVNPLRVWFPLSYGVLCGWWEQIGHREKPRSLSLWNRGPPLQQLCTRGWGVPLPALGMTRHLGSIFGAGSSEAAPLHLFPTPVALCLSSPRAHLSLAPSLENCHHILVRRASGDGVPVGGTLSAPARHVGWSGVIP